ncbi:MAG: DUF4091 domain-containing protein [Clostridia bacterium]|nr:DUF4091 domain-containing protein [Clostridia bacterium]
MITPYLINSLEKVFPDEAPGGELKRFSLLRNETYSFQLVVACENDETACELTFPALPGGRFETYSVEYVPVETPASEKCRDDFLLRGGVPGNYPDVLRPVGDRFILRGKGFHAVWIDLVPDGEYAPGERELTLSVALDGERYDVAAAVRVIDALLSDDGFACTHWFHSDCLADRYGVEVFSEEYWRIVENFVRCAVKHGVNMILTPLFTPPLDTEVGGERTTVQLVDVSRGEDGSWRFGFDKLGRWIDMCLACGAEYFEMSHFFTQWGAKHAPKVIADGKRVFGWETNARGRKYSGFLTALAAELAPYLNAKGVAEKCFFHVSDEPGLDDLAYYKSNAAFLKKLLPGFRFIDALSDYTFYALKVAELPIPCINAIDRFAGRVNELWTYYCCGPAGDNYINRFLYYPSVRNRALGAAMYRYNCKGFLHWGYDFWNTALSRAKVDPYRDATAGGAFPAGDGFVVYPGDDGDAVPSLRFKVFRDGLTDFHALHTLERLAGREAAEALVKDIRFNEYPRTSTEFLALREKINEEIGKY